MEFARLFVYGTLKKGEPNEHIMMDKQHGVAKFIGHSKTVRKFPLLIASRYNVPYLLFQPGIGHRISGEVYEIDDELLTFLDNFENCPTYYERILENVEFKDGSVESIWLYTLKHFKSDLLQKPLMDDYSSKGSHGLEYQKADVDDPQHKHYDDVQKMSR